jgi:hypothetical protein
MGDDAHSSDDLADRSESHPSMPEPGKSNALAMEVTIAPSITEKHMSSYIQTRMRYNDSKF